MNMNIIFKLSMLDHLIFHHLFFFAPREVYASNKFVLSLQKYIQAFGVVSTRTIREQVMISDLETCINHCRDFGTTSLLYMAISGPIVSLILMSDGVKRYYQLVCHLCGTWISIYS